MSKLAPREKAIKPIDEAAINANQFAKSLAVLLSSFELWTLNFELWTDFPKTHKLKIVPKPNSVEPNRAANSDTPKIL